MILSRNLSSPSNSLLHHHHLWEENSSLAVRRKKGWAISLTYCEYQLIDWLLRDVWSHLIEKSVIVPDNTQDDGITLTNNLNENLQSIDAIFINLFNGIESTKNHIKEEEKEEEEEHYWDACKRKKRSFDAMNQRPSIDLFRGYLYDWNFLLSHWIFLRIQLHRCPIIFDNVVSSRTNSREMKSFDLMGSTWPSAAYSIKHQVRQGFPWIVNPRFSNSRIRMKIEQMWMGRNDFHLWTFINGE